MRGKDTAKLLYFMQIVIVLLVAFWLRVQNLDTLPPGLTNDEGVNAVDAFHISQTGNYPMYEDPNRPEPLFRLVQAVGIRIYGSHVWSFRFTSVLVGVLTTAAAAWAIGQCLHDVPLMLRRTAGLAGAFSLAAALGHIALSRSLYRAIPQPLFMFLFTGLLVRALRTGKRRYAVMSAFALAAGLYTYTAALVLPAVLGLVVLSLLAFKRRMWRRWGYVLVVHGVVFFVLVVPIGLMFLDYPVAVIGRAGEVRQESVDMGRQLKGFVDQFFVNGDENPQYNVESAPLLPVGFSWMFAAGLLALVLRARQTSSALIVGFLVLSAIPVIAANEITHGLRIIGEFGAFPLVIGLGFGSVLVIASRYVQSRVIHLVSLVILLVLGLNGGVYAVQTYNAYWEKPERWKIHGRELQHGEWFFRPDRRDLARWIAEQEAPLLVPVTELEWQIVRTWLMPTFPEMTTAVEGELPLPPGTRLVVPWTLESGDLRRDTRHYALLQNGVITLLPPFTQETHTALLAGIDEAQPVTRGTGDIRLLARVKAVPAGLVAAYEPQVASSLVFGDDELGLVGWRGPETIRELASQSLTYTLNWVGMRRMGHEYSSFLQLQTQAGERIAGDDVRILRWLYPTTVWKTGDVIPDAHQFVIPEELEPGAYRLVVGVYPFLTPEEHLPVFTSEGQPLGDSSVIGWVKVPQREMPMLDDSLSMPEVVFGDVIALRDVQANRLEDGRILLRLFWQSLVERPTVDATIFVHVVSGSDQTVTQDDARPWNGQYPTFIWSMGEIVKSEHILEIDSVELADLRLMIGMYTFPGPSRLVLTQDGQSAPDGRFDVGTLVRLLPDA